MRATDRTSRCPDSRSMFWHGILDEACSYLKQLGSLMILPQSRLRHLALKVVIRAPFPSRHSESEAAESDDRDSAGAPFGTVADNVRSVAQNS